MSLTSYRAAPPRVMGGFEEKILLRFADLAATYSPAS